LLCDDDIIALTLYLTPLRPNYGTVAQEFHPSPSSRRAWLNFPFVRRVV